jgi:pre-mRNA cleavage complex 2 protein Pcf11
MAIKSATERESELKRAFVVISAGDETKAISCPICKEMLQPEFMEDDEEWVWRNAIDVNRKVSRLTFRYI